MFPLVHYFVNKRIYASDSRLMILGGLWPDLAGGAGLDRNQAHAMGDHFHQWCQKNAPEALPLALGIIGHGIQPFCVDYYADELWQDGPKGWCFQIGKKYDQRVGAATGLGPDYSWWKAHNFVEICCEMLTDELSPGLGEEIIAALLDESTKHLAAKFLSAYYACDPRPILHIFNKVIDIFALKDLSALHFAEKQKISIASRLSLPSYSCDIPAMAFLLDEMREDVRDEFAPFLDELLHLCTAPMLHYSL